MATPDWGGYSGSGAAADASGNPGLWMQLLQAGAITPRLDETGIPTGQFQDVYGGDLQGQDLQALAAKVPQIQNNAYVNQQQAAHGGNTLDRLMEHYAFPAAMAYMGGQAAIGGLDQAGLVGGASSTTTTAAGGAGADTLGGALTTPAFNSALTSGGAATGLTLDGASGLGAEMGGAAGLQTGASSTALVGGLENAGVLATPAIATTGANFVPLSAFPAATSGLNLASALSTPADVVPTAPPQPGTVPTEPGTPPTSGGVPSAVVQGTGAAAALARLMGGTQTAADMLTLAGALGGPALAALIGSNSINKAQDTQAQIQQSANERWATALGLGAPSRARYEASMSPNFDPNSIPGYSGALKTASDATYRSLSASGGNPWGNPGALIAGNKSIMDSTALPAIHDYQTLNSNSGGLTAFGNAAAAGPSTSGATGVAQTDIAQANLYGSLLGNSITPQQPQYNIFNPVRQPTLADYMKG